MSDLTSGGAAKPGEDKPARADTPLDSRALISPATTPVRAAPALDLRVLLCFALLGSLIAWGIMQRCYPFYTIYSPAPNAPAAPRGPRELDKDEVFVWNMRLGYGVYGVAVGACLGLGFAFARRSILWSIAGLLIGGGFGALAGYFGGDLSNKFFEAMGRTADTNVLVQSMIGQALVWTLCGLSFGFSLALLSSGWARRGYAILAGIISGLLAGAVHTPLHMAIFAENDVNLRLPVGSGAQLMWLAIPSLAAALLLAGLNPSAAKTPQSA